MKIAVAGLDGRIDTEDVEVAFQRVSADLGTAPDLVMAWHSAPLGDLPHERLHRLVDPHRLIGASSCHGALSNAG